MFEAAKKHIKAARDLVELAKAFKTLSASVDHFIEIAETHVLMAELYIK